MCLVFGYYYIDYSSYSLYFIVFFYISIYYNPSPSTTYCCVCFITLYYHYPTGLFCGIHLIYPFLETCTHLLPPCPCALVIFELCHIPFPLAPLPPTLYPFTPSPLPCVPSPYPTYMPYLVQILPYLRQDYCLVCFPHATLRHMTFCAFAPLPL